MRNTVLRAATRVRWPVALVIACAAAAVSAALPQGVSTVVLTEPPPSPCTGSGSCTYSSSYYSSARYDLTDRTDVERLSVLGGVDLDGDGRPDLVVGDPGAESGRGLVYVLYGGGTSLWGDYALEAGVGLSGKAAGEAAGTSLAGGDLTGDGVPDLVVGAPGVNGNQGAVYVLPGGRRWTSGDLSGVSGAREVTGAGGDGLGAAVAVGDVTGDNLPDLLAGAPDKARVYLEFGPVDTGSAAQGVAFVGAAGDRTGAAVAVGGDLNRDGRVDLVIGAPDARDLQGAVYLINGRSRTDFQSAATAGAIDLNGQLSSKRVISGDLTAGLAPIGQLGAAVAAVGDINNDGYVDVAAGAPSAPLTSDSPSDDHTGRVVLLFGGATATSNTASTELSKINSYFVGETVGDELGSALSGAGDIDADGIPDLLAAAHHADGRNVAVGDDYGAVYLVAGRKTWLGFGKSIVESAGVRFSGESKFDRVGDAVFGAPGLNLDGDSYLELYIAAPGELTDSGEGRVFLVLFGDFYDKDTDGQSRALGDCNDADKTVYYIADGSSETCDGKDNDCDGKGDDTDSPVKGQSVYYVDGDGDGWGGVDVKACVQPAGTVTRGGDCNDADGAVHPEAVEVCDGKDNDCDAKIDTADPSLDGLDYYPDGDGDGYGASSGTAVQGCPSAPPAGRVADHGDCDDLNPAVNPAAQEVCDGRDNDCDGLTDDSDPSTSGRKTWYADRDSDGFGDGASSTLSCSSTSPAGYTATSGDCDDADAAVYPGHPEICDGKDNDCDGLVDADDPDVVQNLPYFPDTDGDGYGDGDAVVVNCSASPPAGYASADGDCDEADPEINPGADEVCDGIDNDCDGQVDDADVDVVGASVYFQDADGDGHGDPDAPVPSCTAAMPAGSVGSGDDCDDGRAEVYPGAPEGDGQDPEYTCQIADGLDNDCDGQIDESTCSSDDDGDGVVEEEGGPEDGGDCDDADPGAYPGADELCDGVDQDCDGDPTNGYDGDGDGHVSDTVCPGAPNADDCDDSDPSIYGGADELCDGEDNNCDGENDEASDRDADGYASDKGCVGDGSGNDCDDDDAAVYPGAGELCDGVDQDCDDQVDEDFDSDEDGFVADDRCPGYAGEVDCDDGDGGVNPAALEVCDGVDNNCADGLTDEQLDEDADGFTVCALEAPELDDCDDRDATSYPGASPVCDGRDHDCDALPDSESAAFDRDSDGFLDAVACASLGGALDCDDRNNQVNPGSEEVPGDGMDNNCDGSLEPVGEDLHFEGEGLGCGCTQGAGVRGPLLPSGALWLALALWITKRGGRRPDGNRRLRISLRRDRGAAADSRPARST